MAPLRSALLLVLVSGFVVFENFILIPSCRISGSTTGDEAVAKPDDLKVMMVADLMLKGSDAGMMDLYFRDLYTSKLLKVCIRHSNLKLKDVDIYQKSLERLKPDMLLVLGDISAEGIELSASKWLTVLQKFQLMLGPLMGLPLHIGLGDRDIGDCGNLDSNFVSRIASHLPGLNSAGCGAFEISNTSFISLNDVALLCDNNDLRFSVEKVIESEHLELQTQIRGTFEESTEPSRPTMDSSNFFWRENYAASGTGPVLLLHFPLHRATGHKYGGIDTIGDYSYEASRTSVNSAIGNAGPYALNHTLPPNVTVYIFQSLKPRMVFSAHAHCFCDYSHSDGTREVTLPAMSWAAKGEPGFVIATFGQNKAVTVSHCSIAKESHVLLAYFSMFIILIATVLVVRQSSFINLF